MGREPEEPQIVPWGQEERMPGNQREAFLDFCRKNPLCLQDAEKGDAIFAVNTLVSEGMKPHDLMRRIVHSAYSDRLFEALVKIFCAPGNKDRLDLLDAVVRQRKSVWEMNILDTNRIGEIFDKADDFEYLLKNFSHLLFDQGGHLFEVFHPDEYWRIRVTRYYLKKDFRRAWDELKKADRGFFIGREEDRPLFGRLDPDFYAYRAHDVTVENLTRRLFSYMEEAKLIALTEDDVLAVGPDDGSMDRATVAMWRKMDRHWKGVRKVARRKKLEASFEVKIKNFETDGGQLQLSLDTTRRHSSA